MGNKFKLKKERKEGLIVLIIFVGVICLIIVVLEIKAFLINPYRGILDLVRDLIAMTVGFFVGYWVNKIEKYIIPEYKLSIVFGFLFLGLGWVLNSLLRFGINLFSSSETYYGLMIFILSIFALTLMHKKYKKLKKSKRGYKFRFRPTK